MSDDFKSFPASDQKLSRLRDEGIFPMSRVVFAASGVLALSLSVISLPLLFSKKIQEFAEQAFSSKENFMVSINDLSEIIFSFSFYNFVFFGGIILILGLIQSRFFINFSLFNFDISRIVSQIFSVRISISSILGFLILLSCSLGVVIFAYTALVGSVDTYAFFQSKIPDAPASYLELSKVEKLTVSKNLSTAFEKLNPVIIICVFFSLILGLSCYFLKRILFFREHMMTRAEIESEAREQEVSYELKEQMNERQFE